MSAAGEDTGMADPIELSVRGHGHDLGGGFFSAGASCQDVAAQRVGPIHFPRFISGHGCATRWRHGGPAILIGLATVTYLFEGVSHRDSRGHCSRQSAERRQR